AALKVAWRKPPPAAVTPVSLASSRGKITVRLDAEDVVTEAELTLVDLGRSVRDWKLQLPERARVRLANPADRGRLRGDIQGSGSKDGVVTIPLKAPGAAPLTVAVSARQPRGNGALTVGPFAAVGAASQRGVLWVVADSDQRVSCLPFS